MKANIIGFGVADITLSRRNLRTLLAKLDDHPADGEKSIARWDGVATVIVRAEEDEVHYAERPAGKMHPETESEIARQQREGGR